MKKKVFLIIFLILLGIFIGTFYFYKNVMDGGGARVKIIREASNIQESELISQAEKIACINNDPCIDLSNLDQAFTEANAFNAKNNNIWHLYNRKSIYYTATIKKISDFGVNELKGYRGISYYDSQKKPIDFQICLEEVGSDGFSVHQRYTHCEGRWTPQGGCESSLNRTLFFTNNNSYVCGTQSFFALI